MELFAFECVISVRLQGFNISHTASRLMSMAKPAYSAVLKLAGVLRRRAALLFVPNRKQARLTAIDMLTFAAADGQPNRFLQLPADDPDLAMTLAQLQDDTLKETLASGVGYLHEGLADTDRRVVEHLFNSGAVQVSRRSWKK